MNTAEVETILNDILAAWRIKKYFQLEDFVDQPIAYVMTGPSSGVKYQIEVTVVPDAKDPKLLRITATVEESDVQQSFLAGPDGPVAG